MCRYCAAMYDSVVFMPSAAQTETVLSAPPAATAHMIMSNGPDDALELAGRAQIFGKKAISCSRRTAVEVTVLSTCLSESTWQS